jgi:hypothetical protein
MLSITEIAYRPITAQQRNESFQKGMVKPWFNVLSQQLQRKTRYNHEKLQ